MVLGIHWEPRNVSPMDKRDKEYSEKIIKEIKCYIRKHPLNTKESSKGGTKEQKHTKHRRKSAMADASPPM